jgi:exosortase family protein XrtF
MIKEFRPALLFIGKFLLVYFFGNIAYGLFIQSYYPKPDPITFVVSEQSAWILNQVGYHVALENETSAPKVIMTNDSLAILRIFEGCNGINVIVVFIAFVIAFGGSAKRMFLFILSGTIVLHFVNLLRLAFLFHLAFNRSTSFYLYHKYFFTATLYAIVFALWLIWIFVLNEKKRSTA